MGVFEVIHHQLGLVIYPLIICGIGFIIWILNNTPKDEPETIKTLLFLDDERNPFDVTWVPVNYKDFNITVVRTYNAFVEYIENNPLPDMISLDHDIQDFEYGKEKTGYDCVKFFCEYFMDGYDSLDLFPEMVYHTNNPVGKENMRSYIENCKKFIG